MKLHLRSKLGLPSIWKLGDKVSHNVSASRDQYNGDYCRSLQLPQEVFDTVIDHLHNDLPTLYTCALVNRTWMRSARRHIFHRVSTDFVPPWARSDTSNSKHGYLERVFGLGPSVTNLVRELYFTASSSRPFLQTDRLTELTLSSIIKSLPGLDTLIFDNMVLHPDHFLLTSNQAPISTSLRRLIVCDTLCTTEQHMQIFKLFPFIQDLRLLLPSTREFGPSYSEPSPTPLDQLPLESLSIEGVQWHSLLGLNEGVLWTSLRRLHINISDLQESKMKTCIERIISSASNSLRHLHFVVGNPLRDPHTIEHVHLDLPVDLTSISLKIFAQHKDPNSIQEPPAILSGTVPDEWKVYSAKQWTIALNILQMVRPTALRRINIQIVYSDCDPKDILGGPTYTWAALQEIFLDFDNLERITFSGNTALKSNMQSMLMTPLPDRWKTFLRSKFARILGRIHFLQEPRDICDVERID